MKQLILLSAMLTTVVIGNAQKTLPANRMPVNNRPLTANPALATLVSQARKTTYAGTFNPAPIVRNIGGVNVRSTAVVNGINTDNITTNRPAANGAQTTVENGFECTTSRETVTADSKSFMSVTANGDGIYPGAIYTFNDFMNGNFLREVGVGKRNPIQIFTNNLANSSGNASVTVANPNSANIMNSIASLVRNNSVSNISATQIGQYIYSQNQASLMMNISGGGAYSGFSATASFNMNKQSNHIYVTCDFKIPLYTLYTNFPETGFLSDQNLERTPNLIILNSVTYGTRVLVNIDIDESSLDVKTAAKFKYGDPNSAGFNVDLGFLLSNSSIRTTVNTYIVGANPQNLGNPTSLAQIYSFVDACIRNTNYQTAKPIGYTMSSMAGELIGIRSATDEYMVKNCVPKQSTVYLADATVTISTKGNYKENGSNASFKLYAANGASMIASAVNNNGQMGPNGDNTVGLTMNGQVLKSSLSLGKNFLDIVLDRPNCAFTCDDWEIDNVFLTLNFKDEKGTPLERKFFSICSTPFVIQKGKLLRLEFDGNFRALTQNLY